MGGFVGGKGRKKLVTKLQSPNQRLTLPQHGRGNWLLLSLGEGMQPGREFVHKGGRKFQWVGSLFSS